MKLKQINCNRLIKITNDYLLPTKLFKEDFLQLHIKN